MQEQLMKYSPDTGEERPYPSNAKQWREYHGRVAWLYNPWTGKQRDLLDVGSDVFGELIAPFSKEAGRKRWNEVYGHLPTHSDDVTTVNPVNKALLPCSFVMVDASNVEQGIGGDKVDNFPNMLKRRFYELAPFQREILANNYTKVEHYRDNEWRTKKGTYFHRDGIYRVVNKHEVTKEPTTCPYSGLLVWLP